MDAPSNVTLGRNDSVKQNARPHPGPCGRAQAPRERENLAGALEGSPFSDIFQRGKCEFPLLGERVRVRANPFSAASFRLRLPCPSETGAVSSAITEPALCIRSETPPWIAGPMRSNGERTRPVCNRRRPGDDIRPLTFGRTKRYRAAFRTKCSARRRTRQASGLCSPDQM